MREVKVRRIIGGSRVETQEFGSTLERPVGSDPEQSLQKQGDEVLFQGFGLLLGSE